MNKTTSIVFFSIIVCGIIISVYTLTRRGQSDPSVAATPDPATAASTAAAGNSEPADPKPKAAKSMTASKDKASAPSVEKKKAPPKPAPLANPPGGFTTEKALMDALAKAIKDKNPDLLFELTGQTALSESAREHLAELLKKGDLKLDPQHPLSAIGRTQNTMRWALRLVTPSNEVIELLTDLTKDPQTGWKVIKMRPPAAMKKMGVEGVANAKPSTGKTPATGPSPETADHPDALMVAYAFSKAAINRDINTAQSLTNPEKLKGEKLAALLIALEEGGFRLKTDKPLIVTLTRGDLSWAITRVESNGSKSDFGIEMNLTDDGRWAISGLTFSKLISMTAVAAGAGDVAYSPMRKNPQGGESLVLYFEFDNEIVSARTRKQLMIVADILSQQENRKIHINGHADAKGEDGYNIALSKRRTAAVRSALIELGVDPKQIVTKAFGETMPLKPNFKADGTDNPTGRAQNRRTEIYLDF